MRETLLLKTQDQKKKAFDQLMHSNGTPYSGYRPKRKPKCFRVPRSYHEERVAQILRWISSGLFTSLENQGTKVIEVECMLLRGNLYVATNKEQPCRDLFSLLHRKGLKACLRLLPKGSKESYPYKRAKRHARKIHQRLYKNPDLITSSSPSDQKRARRLDQLVREIPTQNILELSLSKSETIKTTFKTSGFFYVLTHRPQDRGRHAEEWLMDVFEHQDFPKKAFIRGKKRPCLTCSGRIRWVNRKKDKASVNYNLHPGYAYKDRFKDQPEEVARSTYHLMKTSLCYETVDGGTGYDTDSDSESNASETLRFL